ncbi:MAG: Nif3-like dinuclear metal center hexameric protein, partial [Sphingobacteriales bacterium]
MPTFISEIVSFLDKLAPPSLQESYDNAGLLTGDPGVACTGIICSLDVTEAVIKEAVDKGCNVIVAHHPIVFRGLKKINGSNYVERTIIAAIKNDIAIYAIHTNLDNVLHGVSGRMAEMLELQNTTVLAPKDGLLRKLFTFAPLDHVAAVRQAMFSAGAGQIGRYSECSFNSDGTGTFTAGEGTDPYVGRPG